MYFIGTASLSRFLRVLILAYAHYSLCRNKKQYHNYSSENCRSNSRLSHIISHTSYIRNSKPLAIFCRCTAGFVSNFVGNPDNRFSGDEAHILSRPDLNQSTPMKIKFFLTSFHVLIRVDMLRKL